MVKVTDAQPARDLALDEVRDRVRSDIIEARRDKTRDDFHARMRKRYNIRIDWPEPYNDLPATPVAEPKTKRAPQEVNE